jgi:hypothetical protein
MLSWDFHDAGEAGDGWQEHQVLIIIDLKGTQEMRK